ncbi:hypothetical protein JW935_06315, partial [candidate division KSB1 bacterium]|nr:hypothetical protein [candidate division KSB1 bacterium]
MRSFPPLHTRHLTPTQLETARLQLLNVLTSDLSVNTKRISFFSFFQHLITEKYRNLYRSYFLEFANWIPLLTENIANCGWEPRALLLFLRIIELFIRHIDKQTDQMYKLRNKVLTAAIMANLYIGEIEIAAKIAGIDADIIQGKISKCEAQSELKRALFFLDLLEKLEREQNYDISVFIKKWQNLDTYSPNSTPILLVEQIDNASGPLQNTGIITALNGSIRERPSDADQDLISLNNRIHYDKDAIYWSLLDGVAAARSCLGYMNKTRQTYTLQFSMPEKNAIYTGNSIGAPAALLVYALICNRYYRTNFFHLAGLTVITGAIRPNGKILAVDSSGLKSKLKAVFFSPFSRVIVPMENHIEAAQYITKLKKHYPKRHLIIEGIDHLSQALQNRNLTKIEKISTTKKVIGRIKRLPNKYFLFAYTLTLGLLLLLFTFILPGKKGQPANYQVLDGQLRVFDENNVFLWAYDFETQFSTKVYEVGSYNPIIIKDIDHDGKKDILFGTYDNDNANFSGRVWRFDDRGNVVWKRKVGQAVKFGGEIFQDHFRVAQIFVRDLD